MSASSSTSLDELACACCDDDDARAEDRLEERARALVLAVGLGLGLGFHKIKEIEEKKNSKIKVVTQNLLPKRVTGVGTSSRRAGAVGVEVVGGRWRSSAVVSGRQRCQTSSALSDIVSIVRHCQTLSDIVRQT